jgi:LacI family transcriptional regulator
LLPRQATKLVVLLVPDITNDFCADVAISLEHALNEAGLSMVLGNTGEDAGRQDSLLATALDCERVPSSCWVTSTR